jgi:hypothetical protein
MWQEVIRVEESFEDRGASARIGGMGRGVGRVRGTSLGEGSGQQACPMLGPNARDGIALEDVVVNVVLSSADGMGLDPAGEAFRPLARSMTGRSCCPK